MEERRKRREEGGKEGGGGRGEGEEEDKEEKRRKRRNNTGQGIVGWAWELSSDTLSKGTILPAPQCVHQHENSLNSVIEDFYSGPTMQARLSN